MEAVKPVPAEESVKVNKLPLKQLDKLDVLNLVVSELNKLTEKDVVSLQLNLPALPMNSMSFLPEVMNFFVTNESVLVLASEKVQSL